MFRKTNGVNAMKYIINGTILMPQGEVKDRALAIDGARIAGIVEEVPSHAGTVDAGGGYVAPGLVDVHCHGFMGWDASNGSLDELRAMSRQAAKWGTTSWLPTTMTLDWLVLEKCFAAIRAARDESLAETWRGAQVLGCHAEGPFINMKRKGAQAGSSIQTPDIKKLRPWTDVVRLMTVAPEVDGALEFIRAAKALGVTISMGHTAATCEEALAGVDAGVTHSTHTFNAMTPLTHREPGVAGAALLDGRVYCELIADTFHVSPLLYPLMAKQKGDRLVLITDSIQEAHLPDGPHERDGQTIVVNGIRLRFPNGTIAGSALTMDQAVRNFLKYTGLPLYEVVNMASLYPARSIGVDATKGSLESGKDADILITDADFNVKGTFVRGEKVC